MMGADSVAYHRATVLNRSDDHPGQALAYYASRGETPLVWGGSGAGALSLSGNVCDAAYEAIYGPVAPTIRRAGSGWSAPAGRAWSWSSPPTSRWPSWRHRPDRGHAPDHGR